MGCASQAMGSFLQRLIAARLLKDDLAAGVIRLEDEAAPLCAALGLICLMGT